MVRSGYWANVLEWSSILHVAPDLLVTLITMTVHWTVSAMDHSCNYADGHTVIYAECHSTIIGGIGGWSDVLQLCLKFGSG